MGFFGPPRIIKPRTFAQIPITSGRVLHLDATITTSWFDATSGGSAAKLLSRVARWEDQSGNSRHATQTNTANRPRIIKVGDMHGMFFDGDANMIGDFTSLGAQTVCLAGIIIFLSGSNARVFTQRDDNSGQADFNQTGHYIPILQQGGNNKFSSFASSSHRSETATQSEAPLTICAIHNGSSLFTRLNGVDSTSYNHTLNGTFTKYSICGNFSGERATCLIFEVVVFDSALSSSNLLLIENYFKDKYEIF